MLRIGIVAGEASGDLLGAALMDAIRAIHPGVEFEGVAGPRMAASGCQAIYPMERLSLIGLTEVVSHLPAVLRMRNALFGRYERNRPDVFIGIDAPDFNLGLERRLKNRGVKIVHYVSPSVWAWRRYRVRKIARSVDLMLTLFPFEADFYRRNHVPVQFVGHPLADLIPESAERGDVRSQLGLADDGKVIALLPGSRAAELKQLAGAFIRTAQWCRQRDQSLQFVVPLANPSLRKWLDRAIRDWGEDLPLTVLDGRSHDAIPAADAALVASGTAALECMLYKKPMVVAYKMSSPTYWILKRMMRVTQVSPPNLLADGPLVPEFIQGAATPERMGEALLDYFQNPRRVAAMRERFGEIHRSLRQGSSFGAARAVLELAGLPKP